MDWKKMAVEDLRNLRVLQQSVEALPVRIAALEEEAAALKSALDRGERVSGGGTAAAEDRLIDNICLRERLGHNLTAVCRLVGLMELALERMEAGERTVLELFFIERPEHYLDLLQEELGYETAQIYRLKDRALRNFVLAMYGICEL